MASFFSSDLGRLIIVGASALIAMATFVYIYTANAAMAVARCEGDRQKLRTIFILAARYILFFSTEYQSKLFGVSRKDMETIIKYEIYALLESLVAGAVFILLGYGVTQCVFPAK